MTPLLELARKWIGRRVTAETTAAELAERDDFNARATRVWLDYHENAPWAQRKLDAGLSLTPEALEYMEREIASRKLAEEARTKNLETENVEPAEAIAVDGSESPGYGPRDVGGAGEPV